MSAGSQPIKNYRKELFCKHYSLHDNASEAARAATYSPKTAASQGNRLLKDAEIQARIVFLRSELEKKIDLDQEAIIQHWTDVAQADVNEIISRVNGACRYCHGDDHKYQWRMEDEFTQAMQAWLLLSDTKRAIVAMPTDEGGYGYRFRREANPKCPNCEGFGTSQTITHDTTKLSPTARLLYAGVKETQQGIEIKMEDRAAAMVNIARTIGMFAKDNERTINPGDELQDWFNSMTSTGSRPPIQPQKETPPK